MFSCEDQNFFKLKAASGENKQKETPDAAMNQIHSQEYADPYQGKGKSIHLMALVFDKTKRSLLTMRHETL